MKYPMLISILLISLLLVFTACEDDDSNGVQQSLSAEQMAEAISIVVPDVTREITQVGRYKDGFAPSTPVVLRRHLGELAHPIFDPATKWWYFDTTITYADISWAVSESLQFQSVGGEPQMEATGAHLFKWRRHYSMSQSDFSWNYIHRIEYSGINVPPEGESFSHLDGSGRWSYDFTGDDGKFIFTVNVDYEDIRLRWLDGICDDYPDAGRYSIRYTGWPVMTLEFMGGPNARLELTDLDGEEWRFLVDLETGEVVRLPT